jgi:hypothetical protein
VTAVVKMTVGGQPWAGKTVQWHGEDIAITDDAGPSRPASFEDPGPGEPRGVRVVDGVLYGPDLDHGWVNLGDPSHIDPDSGTTPAETMAAIREDVDGATLDRLADGMSGWTTDGQADGSTVYRGTAAAGLVAPETGVKEGETIRVLPFGYVAHDDAEDPSAPLDVAITVGADGLVREIAVAWGTGATAWTYTVSYHDLGTTAPIEAPEDAVSIALRRLP